MGINIKECKTVKELKSKIEIHEKGCILGGYLIRSKKFGLIFHRSNQREKEVFVDGYCGNKYGLGMDVSILWYCRMNDVEYIVIETQYAFYEISVSSFVENSHPHAGLKGLWMCCENNFIKRKKEGKKKSETPNERRVRRQKEINELANKVNKKAAENAKKAKKEGKQIGNKPKKPETKKYKIGEQTSMF